MSSLPIPGSPTMADQELHKSPTRSIPSPSGKSNSASVAIATPDHVGNRAEQDAAKENTQHKVPKHKKTNETERDKEGRIKITIVGAAFVPSHHMLYRIRHMIRRQYAYSNPWITWDEFPENRKLLLFKQLKWRFTWDESIDDNVYSLWKAKANTYLHQALTNARISGKRPSWFCDENWSLMLRKWKQKEKPRLHHHGVGIKRAYPIEEGPKNAKPQKKKGEWSGKIAPEAHTEASSNGDNVAPKVVEVPIKGSRAQEVVQETKSDTATSAIRALHSPNLQEQVNELREETREMVRQLEEKLKRQQDLMQIMVNVIIESFARQAHNPSPLWSGFGFTNGGGSQFGVPPASIYGFPQVETQQQSRLPAWLVTPGLADGSHHGPALVPMSDGNNADIGKPRNQAKASGGGRK